MEIWKPVEQTPNRFRTEFEFSTPNFEPNPNLSEKYGIDRVKFRKLCGSVRDIYVLFSTLVPTPCDESQPSVLAGVPDCTVFLVSSDLADVVD